MQKWLKKLKNIRRFIQKRGLRKSDIRHLKLFLIILTHTTNLSYNLLSKLMNEIDKLIETLNQSE